MNPYVRTGPFTDYAGPDVTAAFLNDVENALVALNSSILYAPAPSGGDDTAALQPLITAAQNTNGTVILRAGTYMVNLVTAQAFVQPKIIGQGKTYTVLLPTNPAQATLTFNGGSGGNSGGYFADLSFGNTATTAGIGVEIANACDVHWDRVGFTGNLAEGIRFHTTQSAGFTEFNNGEATFDSTVVTAVRYMTDNATQSSFHGSGLTGGMINTGTGPAIQIDNYAFPYNAPMNVTFFAHTGPHAFLFRNNFTTQKVGFWGTLKIENQTGALMSAADSSAGVVLYAGQISALTNGIDLGSLYQVKKIYWNGGGTQVQYDPFHWYLTFNATTQAANLLLQNGEAALVNVNITAPNYGAQYQLMVWQNPFNPSGTVTTLAGSVYNNGTGVGAPTFAVNNYQLQITNGSYTSAYGATVSVVHLGGQTNGLDLHQ